MRKLDESKVEWILQEKRKCTANRVIAQAIDVSVRWVQKLYSRYKDKTEMSHPYPMCRPAKGLPGRREHSAVLCQNR